jgi:hypothetical protein
MKRAHRTAHRIVWPALALLVGFGLAMSLLMREPPPKPSASIETQP